MLEEQNALYGRFLLTIQLKELNYKEVAEFYQSKSVYDKIAFYAVLGGFPYVNGFVDEKNHCDIRNLQEVITILANGETLPKSCFDHPLKGDYSGYRECHVEPDWLLVYKITESVLILTLYRTGTHSDLF